MTTFSKEAEALAAGDVCAFRSADSGQLALLQEAAARGATHARVVQVIHGTGVDVVEFQPFIPDQPTIEFRPLGLFLGTFVLKYRRACKTA